MVTRYQDFRWWFRFSLTVLTDTFEYFGRKDVNPMSLYLISGTLRICLAALPSLKSLWSHLPSHVQFWDFFFSFCLHVPHFWKQREMSASVRTPSNTAGIQVYKNIKEVLEETFSHMVENWQCKQTHLLPSALLKTLYKSSFFYFLSVNKGAMSLTSLFWMVG